MNVAYRVKLKTTNAIGDYVNVSDNVYVRVENGLAFVVTENPERIFSFFGKDNVLSVERLGIGVDVDEV